MFWQSLRTRGAAVAAIVATGGGAVLANRALLLRAVAPPDPIGTLSARLRLPAPRARPSRLRTPVRPHPLRQRERDD
jgi:hypothetical protein